VPVPVAARVCGLSLAGIAGSNPTGGMDVSLVSAVLSEIPASGRPLVQRSPIEYGVSECDSDVL
jgi:hypothetical protein